MWPFHIRLIAGGEIAQPPRAMHTHYATDYGFLICLFTDYLNTTFSYEYR